MVVAWCFLHHWEIFNLFSIGRFGGVCRLGLSHLVVKNHEIIAMSKKKTHILHCEASVRSQLHAETWLQEPGGWTLFLGQICHEISSVHVRNVVNPMAAISGDTGDGLLSVIWRFPQIGVPLFIIHFYRISLINHPAMGYPHDNGNPHISLLIAGIATPHHHGLRWTPSRTNSSIAQPSPAKCKLL